jgi:putative methionine-R-sulfoxide reductase with GAF domain
MALCAATVISIATGLAIPMAAEADVLVNKAGKMLNRVQNGLNLQLNSWSPVRGLALRFATRKYSNFRGSAILLPPWTSSRRLWAGAASGGDGLPNSSSRRRRSPRVTDSPAPAQRRAGDVRKEGSPCQGKGTGKSRNVPKITHKKCYRPEIWNKTDWTPEEQGKGAASEVVIIKSILHGHPQNLGKVRFIILGQKDASFIPDEYKSFPYFNVGDGEAQKALLSLLDAPVTSSPSRDTSIKTNNEWTMTPQRPANWRDDEYAGEILASVYTLRDRSRIDAKRKAEQTIMNIMGSLTERFGATSSWLFLKTDDSDGEAWIEPDNKISLAYFHNTGITFLEVCAKARGNGIVGHVASTRRPYLCNDVRSGNDPYYLRSVDSTKSELAVPINCVDSKGIERLIGVFNLESSEWNAFLDSHQGELMAASTKLAPEILILHYLDHHPKAFGWHPDTLGWTLEDLIEDFCTAVSAHAGKTTVQQEDRSVGKLTRPSCTIWYLDREERRLYVRGTARFDYEYVNRRGLGENSFTWQVAYLGNGVVGYGEPSKLPGFERTRKSRNMGMVYAFAAPVFRPSDHAHTLPVGSINLYFFWEELRKQVDNNVETLKDRFPAWVLLDLAKLLGELIEGIQKLRIEVAAAYLRYRLHEHALPGITDFETVKEVILTCLDGDCCSVFARQPPDRPEKILGTLRCLATTGLRRFDGTAVDLAEISYDLDDPDEHGIASYLAESSNRNLRCRSTVDLVTRQGKSQLTPVNKYRETYSHTDTEHRPFLGISVDDPIDPAKPPTGIIRVLRRSGSKPFVHTDELLLRRIARDCHFLFYRWKESRLLREEREQPAVCGARYPFLIRVVRKGTSQSQLNAIDQLGTEFVPGAVWNRRQVDAVLLDLIDLFRNPDRKGGKQGGLIANFRLTQPRISNLSNRENRIVSIHAPLSSDPPPEERLIKHESAKVSVGLMAIEEQHAITFDAKCQYFQPILSESVNVVSGVCMPIRFLSNRGTVWGVLSLDCDDMTFDEWREEHLHVLALAARKLDFIGRDNCLRDEAVYRCMNWRDAMEQFLSLVRRTMDVDVCNIQYKASKLSFLALPGAHVQKIQDASGDFRNLRGDPGARWNERGVFKIKLGFGAFDAGLELSGIFNTVPRFNDPDLLEESIITKIVDISQLWSRFTNSRVGSGVIPLFTISFSEGPPREGIRVWKQNVEIAPDVFSRGPVPFRRDT